MFGTFISDAYTKDEISEMANSLDELCSPNDLTGWASSGIYSFWNFYTKEIYYIGLTIDIGNRFRQHNGILQIKDNACKYLQIMDYFCKNERLGYSIFVQSPLNQTQTYRNQPNFFFDTDTEWINQESKEGIQIIEGSFLEAFKKKNGNYPEWNKIGGSEIGSKRATLEMYEQLSTCITGNPYDPLVARSSIREIANNSAFEWYETNLHAARMAIIRRGISFEQSIMEQIEVNPFFNQVYKEIISVNYLDKHIKL